MNKVTSVEIRKCDTGNETGISSGLLCRSCAVAEFKVTWVSGDMSELSSNS